MAKAPVKTGKKKSFKKKEKRVVHTGIVHIQATFNNTIVTIRGLGREYHLLVEARVRWASAGRGRGRRSPRSRRL